MAEITLSEELHRNFHFFWDNFPFPVLLIHRDRTILDRNTAAEGVGCIPGTRCIDQGNKEAHQSCLANQALSEKTTKRSVEFVTGWDRVMDSYWIPLPGHDDIFVHFGIDITEYAAERLFPKHCASGSGCASCSGT